MSLLQFNIWEEKYRPKTLDDMILEDSVKDYIKNTPIDRFKHLCLSGPAGIGKTSLAKIIANSIFDAQYLYINASESRGIDALRGEIMSFANTKSIDGKVKFIICDEFDGVTNDFQDALRNIMETYYDTCRFILTCNYKHKVSEPILSRCVSFEIVPSITGCLERAVYILQNENITVDDSQLESLKELIRKHYPDLRSIVKLLQVFCKNGTIKIDAKHFNTEFVSKLFNTIKGTKACSKVREFYINNEAEFNTDYYRLMYEMFQYVDKYDGFTEEQKRYIIIVIADHMYKHTAYMDAEINFYAMVINLMEGNK